MLTSVPIGMSIANIELLVAHLIRCPEVILAALDKFPPEKFDRPYEEPYRLLWLLSQEFYVLHGKPIPKLHLESAIRDRIQAPELQIHVQKLYEMLSWVYAANDSDFVPDAAIMLLQSLIDERVVQPQLQKLHTNAADAVDELNRVFNTSRVGLTKAVNVFDFADPTINQSVKPVLATGCEVFDRLTDGGFRPAHMTGILAPTGGGKTLLGTDIAVNVAKNKHHVAYLQYEQDVKLDIRPRIWSCATGIPSKVLSETAFNQLAPTIQDTLRSMADLGNYLHTYDMRLPTTGNGGALEVETVLTNMVSSGKKPSVVIIDWLGVMIKRYLSANNLEFEKYLHSTYNQTISKLRDITNKYEVEMIITHQLNADAGKKGPTSRPSVYEAQEFRSFALLMDTCIIISKATDDGICSIFNDKNRGPRDDCFAKLRGDISKFEIQKGQFGVMADAFGKLHSVRHDASLDTLDGVS